MTAPRPRARSSAGGAARAGGGRGGRAGGWRRLAEPARGPRILIATPDALLQRVSPRETWAEAGVMLKAGQPCALAALKAYLDRAGYVLDERVDESGEAAIRGGVID